MPSIGTVSADLILNSASFISNFQKAADATAQNTAKISNQLTSIKGSFTDVGNFIKGFATAFVSAEGLKNIVNVGISAVSAADQIGDAAKRIGTSAEDLQRYRFAAEQAGVSTGALDTALKAFGLNFAQGKLATDQQTLTAALQDYIAKIQAAPSYVEKAQVAAEGFGRQWQVGIQLAAEGAAKFQQNVNSASVISDGLVRKADAIVDAWGRVKNAMATGFATGVLTAFGKDMDLAADKINALNKVLNKAGELVGILINSFYECAGAGDYVGTQIKEAFKGVLESIQGAIDKVKEYIKSWYDAFPSGAPHAGGGGKTGYPPGLAEPAGYAGMPYTFGGYEPAAGVAEPSTGGSALRTYGPLMTPGISQQWGAFTAGLENSTTALWNMSAGAETLGTSVLGAATAADAAGAGLGDAGKAAADSAGSVSNFGQGVTNSASSLGNFGQGLTTVNYYLDDASGSLGSFADGVSGCLGPLAQFDDSLHGFITSLSSLTGGLGGFGTGLGAAGLGLNSFNQGLMGILQIPGFSSGIENFMRPGPNDFSNINLGAWRSGVDMAFQKGMGYINTMLSAGLTSIGSDFIRWQGSLRSRYIIMDENGNYRIGTAIPYDAVGAQAGTPGDFTFALAKKAQAQAAIAAQIAAAEQAAADKKAAKEAKKKQKELEETIATEDRSFQGTVSAGKQIPSVHITLEGTTNLFTREQVIALIDQMGEAIGDGARISIS